MTEWRDLENLPPGMKDFQRWYHPADGPRVFHPADVDLLLTHESRRSQVMIEIKPETSQMTRGQEITLRFFSRLNDNISVVLYDPTPRRTEDYDPETIIRMSVSKKGSKPVEMYRKISAVNASLIEWAGGVSEEPRSNTPRAKTGLDNFDLWLPNLKGAATEMDAVLHTLQQNSYLFFEFVPLGGTLSPARLSAVKSLAVNVNTQIVVIEDPLLGTEGRQDMAPDQELNIRVYSGRTSPKGYETHSLTLKELNNLIFGWLERTKQR